VLAILIASTALAAGPTAETLLAGIRKELGQGCHEASFVQTYVPVGFGTGRGQAGRLVITPPERIRFEYAEPKGRVFTVDGDRVTTLEPDSKSWRTEQISAEERARQPLFTLVLGRRPDGFRLETETVDGDPALVVVPEHPTDDLARGRAVFTHDGRRIRRIEWEDAEGNQNRFELERLAPLRDCPDSLFRPPLPAGWRVEGDGG